MKLKSITSYLHEHIPITLHLGAEVVYYDRSEVRIEAPLEPNLNHRNTAFGGSIATLGILSGWVLLHLNLREEGLESRLVIQRSQIDFLEPITGDFESRSTLPEGEKWEKFILTLRKYGRARISIPSTISYSGRDGGRLEGDYVALLLKV